ncbi:hypothetical protein EDD85DRAFT_792421 [Armillaria nabsnona]|nr:hypothetical protein EDD85DRAFT_792421 [Armillaria nabsnona]
MAPRTREQFVADQTGPMPTVITTDLSKKTLVLIGANVGLGFEAAKHFARMKPVRLVLIARDEAKGKQALAHIIIAFAEKGKHELDRLDILIENASIMTRDYEQVEGWKKIIHTNNLGPGLPAIHMIPKMLKTAHKHSVNPRLIVVASEIHYSTKIKKDVIASPSILVKLSIIRQGVLHERHLRAITFEWHDPSPISMLSSSGNSDPNSAHGNWHEVPDPSFRRSMMCSTGSITVVSVLVKPLVGREELTRGYPSEIQNWGAMHMGSWDEYFALMGN